MHTNSKDSLQGWLREQLPDAFKFAHVNRLTGQGSLLPTATYAIRVLNLFVKLGLIKQIVHTKTRERRTIRSFSYEWEGRPEKGKQRIIDEALQLWLLTEHEFSTDDLKEFSNQEYWICSRNRTALYRLLNRLIRLGALKKTGHGRYSWTIWE